MFETQSYSITVTVLWFYDYFLTLDDEVAEFPTITSRGSA